MSGETKTHVSDSSVEVVECGGAILARIFTQQESVYCHDIRVIGGREERSKSRDHSQSMVSKRQASDAAHAYSAFDNDGNFHQALFNSLVRGS